MTKGNWIFALSIVALSSSFVPAEARFVQTDPVGYQDDNNPYAYVGNDPTDKTDPTGRFSCVNNGNGTQTCTSNGSILDSAAVHAYSAYMHAMYGNNNNSSNNSGSGNSGSNSGTQSGSGQDAIPPAVGPGPNAHNPIPAGPSPTPTKGQQGAIDREGAAHGCHTCGTTDPGTKSGHWVGDHQPPTRLNPGGKPQVYYPQCRGCSNQQGGRVSGIVKGSEAAPTVQEPETGPESDEQQ